MKPFSTQSEPASPRLTDAQEFAAWQALSSIAPVTPDLPGATASTLPEVGGGEPTPKASMLSSLGGHLERLDTTARSAGQAVMQLAMAPLRWAQR